MSAAAASSQSTSGRPRRVRRSAAEWSRVAILTSLFAAILIAFLSPLAYSLITSLKTPDQITAPNAPILPSDPATYDYNGKTVSIYNVPMPDGTIRQLALIKPGRTQADFIDPANPGAGPITWQGSYRTLTQPWQVAPHPENYQQVWDLINFPLLLRNTIALSAGPSATPPCS
jgi:multiple sugar transport system permease protein